MFVPVQDNYLAIYPFYCFWFFKPFLKMNVKEFSFSCVSLFNYQGSCRLTAPTFYHIVFRLSSTFLKSFFAAFRHLCSFATAILDYHICISLSRTFLNFFLKDPCNYLKSIVYYTSATKQRFHSQVGKAEDCNSSTIGSSPVGTSIRVPWWRNW